MITLRLDKNGGINKGDVQAFEHDNLSEVYIIQLYKNGAIYDLTNKNIELTMVERKRKIGDMVSLPIYNATEGKVKLEVVSDITKQDGIYDFKLTVKDTTGLIETFPNFQVEIKNDITDSITGEIIQDPNFTILTEGLKALADYNIYKTNALKVPEIEQDIVDLNSQLEQNTNLITDIGISYSKFENFSSMEDYIITQIVNTGGANHDKGTVVIDIPAGSYVIKDTDILSKYTRRVGGLKFRGRGAELTRILFRPSDENAYLFKNNDIWLSIRFEGISFYGDITKNTNFMLSSSNGGAQNYVFTDCFFGNFDKIIDLKGTNNNSEFSFYSCNFNGIIKNVLYSGADVGSGGDQFLNYNFFACNYEVSEGNFINMYRGGNVNVWGGSFIHIDYDSENARGGTFFKFPLDTHSYGVCRLMVSGARFELRNRNSMLIDCNWNQGNIEFLNCDMQSYFDVSKQWLSAIFNSVSCNIKFDNCSICGKHKYKYNANSYLYNNIIEYTNCEINNSIEDFILIENIDETPNIGGIPKINFTKCNRTDYNLNGVYKKGNVDKKIYSVKNQKGSFEINGNHIPFHLPIGSIITNIKMYCPANAMTGGYKADYTVTTSETNPTVLARTGHDTEYKPLLSDGFNVNIDLFFVCDTAEKSKLKLTSRNDTNVFSNKCVCLVEYI